MFSGWGRFFFVLSDLVKFSLQVATAMVLQSTCWIMYFCSNCKMYSDLSRNHCNLQVAPTRLEPDGIAQYWVEYNSSKLWDITVLHSTELSTIPKALRYHGLAQYWVEYNPPKLWDITVLHITELSTIPQSFETSRSCTVLCWLQSPKALRYHGLAQYWVEYNPSKLWDITVQSLNSTQYCHYSLQGLSFNQWRYRLVHKGHDASFIHLYMIHKGHDV